jgi:oxalate decarboxylase
MCRRSKDDPLAKFFFNRYHLHLLGHYIENRGTTPVRLLEVFKSSHYADVSLNQRLALTPPELVQAHLKLDPQTLAAFYKEKSPVVPV